MNFKRASLALALATLAVTHAGCAAEEVSDDVDETSEALTNGRIVVKQFGSPGPQLGKWGYDVKQDGRSRKLTPKAANEIFGEIGMNMLRVAVRAHDAHPSRGVENIRRAEYADDLEAIKNAKAAKPGVDIFASVKLLGDKSFPGWVKDGGDVSAAKYAELLENYLAFMKENGVTIDWLGVDNERRFNEGNITPAKYNTIVSDVKSWCKNHDVKVPGFFAAVDYGPAEDTGWLQDLWQTPAQFKNVDHVGVHTYSKHRNAGYVDAMQKLANNDHGKGLWNTELHWNDRDDDNATRFDDIKPGMLAVMDHFDLGFHALSWWAFQPRSQQTKSSYIMSELVSSTVGASKLPTDDEDGKEVGGNKLNSQAFKKGPNQVTLWVANFDGKQKSQATEIANQTVTAASYVQWSASSAADGKTGAASINKKNPSRFSMTYPANTITRVTVTVK